MFACTQIYPKVMVAFVLVLTSFGLLLIPYFQHVLIDSRPTKKIIPFVAVATNMFEFFLKTLVTVHNTLHLLLLFLWLKPSRFGFEFYFLFFWFLKYAKHSSEIKSKSLHGYSFRSSWIWCLDHEHFGDDFFPFVRCFIRLESPMEFQYRMQFKRCVDRLSGVYKFGCVNFTITEVQISWFMKKKKK